jgi:PDZ domain-containing protein
MDPDPDSLTDDMASGRSRDPARGTDPLGVESASLGGDRAAIDPVKAQAAQDAWVARWSGWSERGGRRPADGSPFPAAPPTEADRAGEGPRRRLWLWSGGFTLGVLIAAIIGGVLLDVPYVALVPGSAKDTEPLLAVSGTSEYPSEGELLLTTVRVRQRPNLWEYLWLKLDDDATVVPEEQILGDRTAEENRQFNLSMMDNSKQIAVAVALQQLGYDAITTDGVLVQQLVPDAPAEDVLELGDTIVDIDGEPTMSTADLIDILAGHEPGDEVSLTVESFSGGDPEVVTVVLAANPDKPEAGFLGIQPIDRPRYGGDVGFTVEIDSGAVGGPSAGLAFTLAVLDQLTEGELTGGAQVAVTGTIHADGSVGAVGGVLQKTAAVEALGVDAFIVPANLDSRELDDVMARAGDDLEIIPVADLDEALDALAGLGGDVGAVEEYAAVNLASASAD